MGKYVLENNKLLNLDSFDCIEFENDFDIVLKKLDINSTEENFLKVYKLGNARNHLVKYGVNEYCLNMSPEKLLEIMKIFKLRFIEFLSQDETKIFDLYENYKTIFTEVLMLADKVDEYDYIDYCKNITE